jgi:hypothetical protein
MNLHLYGFFWLSAALFLGLLNCFFGYRLFLVTVGFLGLLFGSWAGYYIGNWLSPPIPTIVFIIVLGLIGVWASISGYYAFIFVLGAFAFALLAGVIGGLYANDVPALLLFVFGLIGGFISLWLQRIIIIFATAAQGALSVIFALFAFISGRGVIAYQQLFRRLLEGELGRRGGLWFYVGAFFWLVLFVAGVVAQFTRGKEMYRAPRRPEAEIQG